jgi:hypothetical protein
MDKFTSAEFTLNKNVKKGDKESLISLFSFEERIKRMKVLLDLDEGELVKVVVEGLGEVDLKLGNDMEKGDRKTIMTLFWMPEKSTAFEMLKDAKAGEKVTINMYRPG